MRRINPTFVSVCTVFSVAVGCVPDDSLQNQGFDAWCGENLCLWETHEGRVEKTSTWHRQDFGAAFVEDPTVISQWVENDETKCFLFSVMADVADNAALFFEIDYLGDDLDHPEFSERIESPDWQKTKIDAVVPAWCNEFRVILRKTGKGKAVVASVYDTRYESCPMEIPSDQRPAGFACSDDTDCAAGMCESFTAIDDTAPFYSCGACRTDDDCEADAVCGLESAPQREAMYRACGAPARHTLGERCLFDEECTSGICCEGQCSLCCESGDCPESLACTETTPQEPHRCGPDEGAQEDDTPCLIDNDCRSGHCEPSGSRERLSICTSDGRLCTTDADCPGYLSNDVLWQLVTDYTGTGDRCIGVGVFDGVCQ